MRTSLASLTVLCALLAAGCGCGSDTKRNPNYDRDAGGDSDTDVDTDADSDTESETDTDSDTGSDTDTGTGECSDAAECADDFGPAPCGAWECNAGECEVICPDCTDADRDGYGPDAACAGPDCDDADDTVTDTSSMDCYSGPAGTQDVGNCLGGTRDCVGGIWDAVCNGEVVPATETCDGTDEDCDAAVDQAGADCATVFGAAPCGSWECNAAECEVICAGCTDADLDGYGPEAGVCAGPDCDDADDAIFSDLVRSCYSGPAGTDGVGTCQAGTEECIAGLWNACVGEVTPSGEACNSKDDDCDDSTDEDLGDFSCGIGACFRTVTACVAGGVGVCVPGPTTGSDNDCDGIDDDCDGAIDESCVAGCTFVTPTGNDAVADGSLAAPYRNIQSAIDDAVPGDNICVASNAACGFSFTYNEAVDMADGVSVYGRYESTTGSRCGGSTTVIVPGRDIGVSFDATVVSTTVLDSFQINRANVATSAGVTIDASTDVILSDIRIFENFGGAVINSYAVNMINGAEATITRSLLWGGNGTAESIGVRSVGSLPTVRNNCTTIDAFGRCSIGCGGGNGIRGRFLNSNAGDAFPVYLDDSPGAVVDTTVMCGVNAEQGAGIRVIGDAAGTVLRGNFIDAWGGEDDAHGMWLEDCAGETPWIVDNYRIAGQGDTVAALVDGVRAIGDCHPVIDTNRLIMGGLEGGVSTAIGVYCGANASGASDCVVINNLDIQGSNGGFPPTAIGVRCDDDACNRIEGNAISGEAGVDTYGIWLQESGTFVDNNTITGGCGLNSATGVYANDSFARIQNNRIRSGTCDANVARGMWVFTQAGPNEVDVHSNVIDADGQDIACTGAAIELDVIPGAAPAAGVGIFRNNILRAGYCLGARYDFYESDVAADPRFFESNDLDPFNAPTNLYYDADTGGVNTAAGVNGLLDMTVSGTISSNPTFVAYPVNAHLLGGSPCDGAGTPNGAPATDMDNQARDAVTPDIGPDEI